MDLSALLEARRKRSILENGGADPRLPAVSPAADPLGIFAPREPKRTKYGVPNLKIPRR